MILYDHCFSTISYPRVHLQDELSDEEDIWFIFQKTKYIYDAKEKKDFKQINFPVDLKFSHYVDWKGYQEDDDIRKATRIYGKNR